MLTLSVRTELVTDLLLFFLLLLRLVLVTLMVEDELVDEVLLPSLGFVRQLFVGVARCGGRRVLSCS